MLLQGMFYGSIQKRDLVGIVNLLGIKTEYHIVTCRFEEQGFGVETYSHFTTNVFLVPVD